MYSLNIFCQDALGNKFYQHYIKHSLSLIHVWDLKIKHEQHLGWKVYNRAGGVWGQGRDDTRV